MGTALLAAVLALISTLVSHLVPSDRSGSLALLLLLSLAVALAAGDLWAIGKDRLYPIGAKRQTSKPLMYSGRSDAVIGLIWGLDAGAAVGTYRVTSGVWVVTLLIIFDAVVPWVMVFYGVAFAVGLVLVTVWPMQQSDRVGGLGAVERFRRLAYKRRVAQLSYLCLLPIGLVSVLA